MAEKTTTLHVEGMTCNNCALGVKRTLEKKGLANVHVDFGTNEAVFDAASEVSTKEVIDSINQMGFKAELLENHQEENGLSSVEKRFIFCLVFTVPLFMHMFLPMDSFINNPWLQLALCSPVYIVGGWHFGKSGFKSLQSGVPNMDVLIFTGSTSALVYSIWGTVMYLGTPEAHNYLFFETCASIITLVLLGNVLEHRSVRQTTSALRELMSLQKIKARRVNPDGSISEVDAKEVKVGDLLQINSGDKIPVDGAVASGKGTMDESMLTGESLEILKEEGDTVIGGTIVNSGNFQLRAEKVGKNTILSQIISEVKKAQQSKPSIQKLGDKVSAIFVPAVLGISLLTFLLSYLVFDVSLTHSIMRAIAVLVISCPCAMGLATPTAVMAGVGRAAKNGILIKGGQTLEQLAEIENIAFDKTGTITTGEFKIAEIQHFNDRSEYNRQLIYSLELNSSHPIALSLVTHLENEVQKLELTQVEEIKGEGIYAEHEGHKLALVSRKVAHRIAPEAQLPEADIFLFDNQQLVACVQIKDQLKNSTPEIIGQLKKLGIKTILISGDQKAKTKLAAETAGIDQYFAEQSPTEKLELIEKLSQSASTAMVGDGINDAPALARASVGISPGNATQIAMQSAEVVLLNKKDLQSLITAVKISRHTLKTIKQNLFWAFFYNVLAIPLAAMGMLSPIYAALAMAFSDVIVIGNSIRLKSKRLS